MKIGTYSFPGAYTCYAYFGINSGYPFAFQNSATGEYLSAISNTTLKQISSAHTDPRLWFTFDTLTFQMKSSYNGLCLDDLGRGYSPSSSTNDTVVFTKCRKSSTQQFVYDEGIKRIFNPNNGYEKCFDGNSSYPSIFLWNCLLGGADLGWNILLICPPGIVISY